METTSIQKYIHTSPRKMRLVVDMVKKMHPTRALDVLQFTSKSAAKDLKGVVNTALANAKQDGLQIDAVYFKAIEVNEGPVMKRFRPGSKGRALPYQRRMSHVKIVLSDEVILKDEKKGSKKQEGMQEVSKSEVNEKKTVKKVEETKKVKKEAK